jgi:hypothetical protein
MKLRFTFSDIAVGIPAGTLIFMSTIMFSAVLQNKLDVPAATLRWLDLLLLAMDAAIVGLLCALSRKEQALVTAMISGDVAALILTGLRLSAQTGEAFDPLVFGWPGVLICIFVTPLATLVSRKKKEERSAD